MQNLKSNLSPERVKYFRKDNGWSQELLAKASGLSLRTIQRAEKDGNSSAETQLALAAAFNITTKDLTLVSPQIETQWKWRNIMQSVIALLVIFSAVIMLVMLGGDLAMFSDYYSGVFILLFMYAATAVAFGGHGMIKSIIGLKYLFASDVATSDSTQFLSVILHKQIRFIYGGACIGLIIGLIAILSHFQESLDNGSLPAALAVCLLVLLYACIVAEGILRPLAAKLSARKSTPS
ncbi:MAG: helix-turn-helix domain-containing protein [Cognaticolwellia sp.]